MDEQTENHTGKPHPPRPGFVESLFSSCVSPRFYRRVMDQSLQRSFLYLLGVLAITSLFLSLRFNLELVSATGEVLQQMEVEGFPTITVSDGFAEAEPPGPYLFNTSHANIRLLVNTQVEGEEAIQIFKDADVDVMLTHRRLIVRADETGRREYKLDPLNKTVIDSAMRQKFRRIALTLSFIFLPVALLIFSMIGRLMYAMVFSGGAWLIHGFRQQRMDLRAIFHISIYALTLPILVDTLLTLAEVNIPYLFTILYLIYFVRGLMFARPEAPQPETA